MREQQSVRPAPPRRMSAKQMNSSLLSGIFNGCNGNVGLRTDTCVGEISVNPAALFQVI
jgi:hypothetical protein